MFALPVSSQIKVIQLSLVHRFGGREMRTNSTNIGESIRTLRKARDISRKELSEIIGISISHLEKYGVKKGS